MQYTYSTHFANSPARFGWRTDVWRIRLVNVKLVLHAIYNTMHGTHNIKITPKYLHREMLIEPTERIRKTKHFDSDVRLKDIKQEINLLSNSYNKTN